MYSQSMLVLFMKPVKALRLAVCAFCKHVFQLELELLKHV